ncbi:MBL fold metallo-hydrolase [Paenibacillus sp. CN-4]|uniref:MBL fold metallo-hydrolase n=1 Tax=Paenibacillus nanchangensis TaxID=3348343 RepID=UPI003979E93B
MSGGSGVRPDGGGGRDTGKDRFGQIAGRPGRSFALPDMPADGVLRVAVPMPGPLRQVNAYVFQEADGISVVDPGPRTEANEALWNHLLQDWGLDWRQVRQVVVTHHHPDHYGLSGWMQAQAGCPVLMSRRALEEAGRMWGHTGAGPSGTANRTASGSVSSGPVSGPASGSGGGLRGESGTRQAPEERAEPELNRTLGTFFAAHGMPPEWTSQLPEHLRSFLPQTSPQPDVSIVENGGTVRLGDRTWRAIQTGGHAPGHLSFYDAERELLLCGDAVLPLVSPNISLLPGSDPQPLASFLDGLVLLRRLPVKTAYPGHRDKLTEFAARIDQLLVHHEERLAETEALLASGPRTGFELCLGLFGGRIRGIHQMRFAMSEALAHAAELVRRGRAREVADEAGLRFVLGE